MEVPDEDVVDKRTVVFHVPLPDDARGHALPNSEHSIRSRADGLEVEVVGLRSVGLTNVGKDDCG